MNKWEEEEGRDRLERGEVRRGGEGATRKKGWGRGRGKRGCKRMGIGSGLLIIVAGNGILWGCIGKFTRI